MAIKVVNGILQEKVPVVNSDEGYHTLLIYDNGIFIYIGEDNNYTFELKNPTKKCKVKICWNDLTHEYDMNLWTENLPQ